MNNTTEGTALKGSPPSQHLASVGSQFVLSCCVGGAGGLYCLRSLRKVATSHKVLHKYIAIPNLLVAGLLTCSLIIPLRMFAAMMLLAKDNIFAFCLAIFYIEFLCEITANVSMVILALQRLKGLLRHAFTNVSYHRFRPSRVTVAVSWTGPMTVMSFYVYICSTAAVPPWTLATCTHNFPADTSLLPKGLAIVVDMTFPVVTTLTFCVLSVAYGIIVKQIRQKTCKIHPTPSQSSHGSIVSGQRKQQSHTQR